MPNTEHPALPTQAQALRLLDVDLTAPADAAEGADGFAPGDDIACYRLVTRLGEGGFGIVWEAEQREPVERCVALKILKSAHATPGMRHRFAAERQAMARMDHPGIARILDAGITADGLPFEVMELVRGPAIVEYCAAHHLDTPARLQIFTLVCAAVEHAHGRGVLHRDLKPSNILVSGSGTDAQPKVIDFGLARTLAAGAGEHTAGGHLLGTLAYMSPEQAASGGADVDIRSDVYSLGAVLYELLAGTPPLAVPADKSASLEAVLRAIREEDPVPPGARAASAGGRRPVSDLDWIVLRALAKDRAHRYASPAALAEDVQRFLRHDLVEARPPSLIYRARKFARRHAAALIAAGAVLAALVTGTVVSLLHAQRATSAEHRALAAGEQISLTNEQLQRASYRATIQLAEGRVRTRDRIHTVPAMLHATPPRLRGWEWGWLMAQCQPAPPLLSTGGPALAGLATSPDGRSVFAVRRDGSVTAWDIASRRQLWHSAALDELSAHTVGSGAGAVPMITIEAAAGTVAIYTAHHTGGTWHPRCRLCDAATGAAREWPLRPFPVWTGNFSPVLHPQGTGFYQPALRPAGETASAMEFRALTNPDKPTASVAMPPVAALATEPAGRWIAAVTFATGPVTARDAATLAPVGLPEIPSDNVSCKGAAVSSGPVPFVASAHQDRLRVQMSTGRLRSFRLPGTIHTVRTTRDGTGVFLAGADWSARWLPEEHEPAVRWHDAALTTAAEGADGVVIAGDAAGRVHLLPPPRMMPPVLVPVDTEGPESRHVLFTPDSRTAARVPWRRTDVRLLPLPEPGKPELPPRVLPVPAKYGSPRLPCFDPLSGWYVAGGERTLTWHDLRRPDAPARRTITLPAAPLTAVFAPSGTRLLVSWEGGAALLTVESGQLAPLPSACAGATDFAWSADGSHIIVVHPARDVICYSLTDSRVLWTQPHRHRQAAMNPNEPLCAIASAHGAEVLILDTNNGAVRQRLPIPPTEDANAVSIALAFTPDGRRLLTSGGDDALRLWDWQLGRELLILRHPIRPSAATFSPDGLILAAAGYEPAMTLHFALPWDTE